MSRLTTLIAQAKAKDPALGEELDREFRALADRRAFGLNFERHTPESVDLPGRPVRRGDKVRILPSRGSTAKADPRLWKVVDLSGRRAARAAMLEVLGEIEGAKGEIESRSVPVADLVVVAEFRDAIYPGLISTGRVERGGDAPFHTVINGENFHVLEALTFTHSGKVDAIYIDPPYNTGAKDWKYNNDYVEETDLYRHSKWLAFMERRLKVARELLNPDASVLIVTIDEKEYLRLGLLLEQTFPEAKIQMVSSIINPKGVGRVNEFSRTNEFVYIAMLGEADISPLQIEPEGKPKKLDWQTFRRRDLSSVRQTRPRQFYPIYVSEETGFIECIGEPLDHSTPREQAPKREGCVAVFPVRRDGTEMNWAITGPSFKKRLAKGYIRAGSRTNEPQTYIIQYLKTGSIKDIEDGRATIIGRNADGSVEGLYKNGVLKTPTTQWDYPAHNAEHHGTAIIKALLKRRFPFPKSLYAVEDALRFFVKDNPNAIVLDFFAGSGTTAHAVMRLNRQDGGRRQCISVTNNEVAADEQKTLRKKKLRPGDPEWERWGICDYITKPRIRAAITGQTPEGGPIKGDYKFADAFPMADGFEANAEFFTLTYETPVSVRHNRAFAAIAPLLWMRAGSEGERIGSLPESGWAVVERYALLTDMDRAAKMREDMAARGGTVRIAYLVTDDDARFQQVASTLPDDVEPVRLYASYLSNFRFSHGR